MQHRSKHLPIYTILIGLLLVSLGYNLILHHRLTKATEFIGAINPWISPYDYSLITKEIEKSESEKIQFTK